MCCLIFLYNLLTCNKYNKNIKYHQYILYKKKYYGYKIYKPNLNVIYEEPANFNV